MRIWYVHACFTCAPDGDTMLCAKGSCCFAGIVTGELKTPALALRVCMTPSNGSTNACTRYQEPMPGDASTAFQCAHGVNRTRNDCEDNTVARRLPGYGPREQRSACNVFKSPARYMQPSLSLVMPCVSPGGNSTLAYTPPPQHGSQQRRRTVTRPSSNR